VIVHSRRNIPQVWPKLSWLMFVRVVLTSFLLASTIYSQYHHTSPTELNSIIVLYYLTAFIFLLSLVYAILAKHIKRHTLFTYIQFAIDTVIITLIIHLTGGLNSFFPFLYLIVIIFASMLLYQKGGLFVAALSSSLYTVLIVLEYFALIPSLGGFPHPSGEGTTGLTIVYKILITTVACFAVAILGGLLTEQNRKSQLELRAMEDSLKRVEKMAYMGEMAAGLAHEIKNPLASLVGSIQMLKDDLRYDPDHERLMEIVLRETDRLSSLVNDFLFFARPPAGKPEKIKLDTAITEITELFEKDPAHSKRFKLKKELVPDIWVLIDPTHLSQVMWNLLLNAAEAIEDDGQIQIKTQITRNSLAQIQVHDNGCGIPADVVQSIFDPFYTTKPEGTGLGLSIVHRILESYNSRLDVQTELGQGTIFSFSLDRTNPGLAANP
jgi:signal transduction histidine kinase